MAAADAAKDVAKKGGGVIRWGLRNTVPVFNSAANRNWMLGLTAATALSFLAPPAAFAAAAAAITPTTGALGYAMAGGELAWEGSKVAWDIASAVGGTLPEITTSAVSTAQNAALSAG